jgi:hypothetical protein
MGSDEEEIVILIVVSHVCVDLSQDSVPSLGVSLGDSITVVAISIP